MELPVIQPGRGAAGQPPIFAKIGIVGLGLIGGSIALAAREIWPAALVIGVDNKDVLETAMRLHAIDVAADDSIVLAEADLVILAAPVRQNIALLARARRERPAAGGRHRYRQHQAGDRRGGAGAAAAVHVRRRPSARRRRRERARARAARSVQGPAVAVHADRRRRRRRARQAARVRRARSAPMPRSRSTSRRTIGCSAYLSHLPQLTASALMQVVGDAVGEDGLALAGRGLVDTTRLASSPADIWKDIAATNADEIGAALDALIAVLQDLRGRPGGRRSAGRGLRRGQPLAGLPQQVNACVGSGFSRTVISSVRVSQSLDGDEQQRFAIRERKRGERRRPVAGRFRWLPRPRTGTARTGHGARDRSDRRRANPRAAASDSSSRAGGGRR